jgi:hypothetical protein
MPHPGNGGMNQMPAHIQRQMQQQMQHQEQVYRQQMQQQYQQDVHRFNQWLEANGGSAGAASRLPNNPADFDRWAANQKQRKAQGKSYDQMYDHYQAFLGSMRANSSRPAPNQPGRGRPSHSQSSPWQLLDHANRKNDPQAGAAGSKSGESKKDQATRQDSSTLSKGSTAAQEKQAERSGEEHRLAERRRDEAARRARAQGTLPLAQDQGKISLLRMVHARLQEADHDYQGHRVEALHSLNQALHHLGSAAPPGLGGTLSLGNLPQQQSDGILRDAIVKLKSVESQLGGSANRFSHHAEARASVAHAIRQLDVALRIR